MRRTTRAQKRTQDAHSTFDKLPTILQSPTRVPRGRLPLPPAAEQNGFTDVMRTAPGAAAAHCRRTRPSTRLHLWNIATSMRQQSLLSARPGMDWRMSCICALRGGRTASRHLERCSGGQGRIGGLHGVCMRLLVRIDFRLPSHFIDSLF